MAPVETALANTSMLMKGKIDLIMSHSCVMVTGVFFLAHIAKLVEHFEPNLV